MRWTAFATQRVALLGWAALLLTTATWSAELGSVKDLPEPCPAGPVANTGCRRLQVSCPELKPVVVQIRVTEPSAGVTPRGTVMLGSGGGGNGFYGGGPDAGLIRELAGMGFLVVDRAWAGGWTTHEGGLRKESCRYATLLTWVHDHLHKGGKFVATGNSGGSAEIGYARAATSGIGMRRGCWSGSAKRRARLRRCMMC